MKHQPTAGGGGVNVLLHRFEPHASLLQITDGLDQMWHDRPNRSNRHTTTGTDVSPGSVARARVEARRWGVDVEFGVADFRDLRAIDGPFDVVLSADNALPHLLNDVDVLSALTAMRTRMGDGGLLIVTMRDYDQALLDRPATAMPLVVAGPPRRVVVRLHDWDGPQSAFYTVRFLICTEHDDGQWTTEHHRARYRAMTRVAFTSLEGASNSMRRSGGAARMLGTTSQ